MTSIKELIESFNITIDDKDGINCEETSKLLYEAYLTKFQIEVHPSVKTILDIYQDKIFDFVDYLHMIDISVVEEVLIYLDKNSYPHIADIIIMMWSLPRPQEFKSQSRYDAKYNNLIQQQNYKLCKMLDCYVVRNFCYETITKNNNVPVHCIDILWHSMTGMSIEFKFCGEFDKRYLGYEICTDEENDKDNFVYFKFNLEYLLRLGLGNELYDSQVKVSFKSFSKIFITNQDLFNSIIASKTQSSIHYLHQVKKIILDLPTYYDDINLKLVKIN